MNYPENEVWEMTIGKLITMFREYKKDHGMIEKTATIDDIFGEVE